MQLFNAIVVFLIGNYLKLFLAIAPLCSVWRYYNSSRHVYIILSELVLVLVITLIMFASLAMTKMDCNRIANYLLLPVFLGLGYINSAHYHRAMWTVASGGGSGYGNGDGDEMRSNGTYLSNGALNGSGNGVGNLVTTAAARARQDYSRLSSLSSSSSDTTETTLIDHNNKTVADLINGSTGGMAWDSIVDSVELVSNNGLAVLALLHLTANLFNKQLAKVLN